MVDQVGKDGRLEQNRLKNRVYVPCGSNCLLLRSMLLPWEETGPVLPWLSSCGSSSPALVALSRCTTSSLPIVDGIAPLPFPPKNFTFLASSTYPWRPVSLNLKKRTRQRMNSWQKVAKKSYEKNWQSLNANADKYFMTEILYIDNSWQA